METTINNRNNQGRFVKGHTGAKPKGAVSKKNRKYFERIERVVNLLETNLDENIKNMSNKEKVKLWYELQKFMHTKFTKFTDPEPETDTNSPIIINLVREDGSTIYKSHFPPMP